MAVLMCTEDLGAIPVVPARTADQTGQLGRSRVAAFGESQPITAAVVERRAGVCSPALGRAAMVLSS